MSPTPQWPNDADARLLHAGLSRVPTTATEEFALAYFQPLLDFLACAFPRVPEDLRTSAAVEALLGLIERPDRYDPALGTLAGYLRMAARGDLANLLAKEKRARRGVSLESVEEPVAGGNRGTGTSAEAPSLDDPRIVEAVASFAPPERVTYDLMRAGERRTGAFARALGLDDRRPDAAAVVKRIKDTIKVRLRRAVGGRT